jgi:hypothetical protein
LFSSLFGEGDSISKSRSTDDVSGVSFLLQGSPVASLTHFELASFPTPPTSPMVSALLSDMYQITMAYAYWKADKYNDRAV